MEYSREGRHKVMAWSMGRVGTKQGEQKAQKEPVQALEKFTTLIPNGQQTDVVIKAKKLTVMYRD